MKKETKFVYIRNDFDGWYKVTNNGATVAGHLSRGEAEDLAKEIAKAEGKKVKNMYQF